MQDPNIKSEPNIIKEEDVSEDSEEETNEAESEEESDDKESESDGQTQNDLPEPIPNATFLRERSLAQHFPKIKIALSDISDFDQHLQLPTVTMLNQKTFINKYITDVLTQFLPSVLFTNNANHQAVLIKLGDLWLEKKYRKQFFTKEEWKIGRKFESFGLFYTFCY